MSELYQRPVQVFCPDDAQGAVLLNRYGEVLDDCVWNALCVCVCVWNALCMCVLLFVLVCYCLCVLVFVNLSPSDSVIPSAPSLTHSLTHSTSPTPPCRCSRSKICGRSDSTSTATGTTTARCLWGPAWCYCIRRRGSWCVCVRACV